MESFQSRIKAILANLSPSFSEEIINLETTKPLGKGVFGTVYPVVAKEEIALKKIDFKEFMDVLTSEEELCEQLKSAYSKFQIMKKNIPNVIRSHQCHFDMNKFIFYYIMDLMIKDMGRKIREKIIPFNDFYKLFRDIVTTHYKFFFYNAEKYALLFALCQA
jgi:hypothetical protein